MGLYRGGDKYVLINKFHELNIYVTNQGKTYRPADSEHDTGETDLNKREGRTDQRGT